MTSSGVLFHRLTTRHPNIELEDLSRGDERGRPPSAHFVHTDPTDLLRRLNVYSEGHLGRITEALRNSFERTAQSLGEESFQECVWWYLRWRPSRQPNLRWIGAHFVRFLELEAAERRFAWEGKPWLVDLARLEWARSTAFDAEEVEALSFSQLRSLSPDSWATTSLCWRPEVRRFGSKFDIATAWVDTSEPIARLATTQNLLVWRQEQQVVHRVLVAEEAWLFDELEQGVCLERFCLQVATRLNLDELGAAKAGLSLLRRWTDNGCIQRLPGA